MPRGSKDCPANVTGVPGHPAGARLPCSGVGTCDYDSGTCHCPAGWGGRDCSTREPRPCTHRLREHFKHTKDKWTPVVSRARRRSLAAAVMS